MRTVEGWLQAIPAVFVGKSPKINLAYAWMNLLRGLPSQAMPFIERLRAFFSAVETNTIDPTFQVEWLAIQAELLIAQGRPQESRGLAIQAQKLLPEVDPNIRGMVLTFEILGTSGEAQMVLKQGRLHRTYDIVTQGIRRLEGSGKKVPFSATLYGELGEVCFYWHQFEPAREYFCRSMEISGKSGYSDPEIYFHLMLSKIFQMEGDLDGSVCEMVHASRLAGTLPPAMVQENLIAQQVWVNLATDRPAEAEQLLAARGFHFGENFAFPDLAQGAPVTLEAGLLFNSAFRILLFHAQKGQDQTVLKRGIVLAERVFQGEMQCQHLPVALETLLLLSQMETVRGETQKSLATAAKALDLAEPEGFISPFVEEGQPIADILAELLRGDRLGKAHREYIQEILAAFSHPAYPPGEANKTAAAKSQAENFPGLIEPLTPRELEVLHLIADGDSNQVIADKLVISVSAVKKHTGTSTASYQSTAAPRQSLAPAS